MRTKALDHAIELLEKSNADLEPELLTASFARELLASYAKIEKLAAFGVATLSRKVASSAEVARATGTSAGKAEAVVRTGKAMAASSELSVAMQTGSVSLDQAAEIAKAEEAKPGAAKELLSVARDEAFHVLKEKARKVALEAEQHRDLARRQREARSARSYSDELGMVHVHSPWNLTSVRRSWRGRGRSGQTRQEGEERWRAGAVRAPPRRRVRRALVGNGKGRAKRPELVVLVSHEVAKSGWTDVREGEMCQIPEWGRWSLRWQGDRPGRVLERSLLRRKDLRQFKRWSRAIPVEVATALELGEPPNFDGGVLRRLRKSLQTEFDHVQPRFVQGPTSHPNLKPRCWTATRPRPGAIEARPEPGPDP